MFYCHTFCTLWEHNLSVIIDASAYQKGLGEGILTWKKLLKGKAFKNSLMEPVVINFRDLSLAENPAYVPLKTSLNLVVMYVDSHLYQRVCLVSDSFPSMFPSCFRPWKKPQRCSVCTGHPSYPCRLWHLLLWGEDRKQRKGWVSANSFWLVAFLHSVSFGKLCHW